MLKQNKWVGMTVLIKRMRNLVGQNKIHSLLILLMLAYWLPILRFGFDPHHDGLMIASVTNLDFGDSSVPFNQYGPVWFIMLKLLSGLAPDSYLFLTLRIVTLVCYLISFLATYLFSRKFLSQRYSLGVVIVLLAIQPFVTDFNSDMIPWPSALSMFLIPAIGLLLLESDKFSASGKFNVRCVLAGSLVLLTTLTRVQIGLALLATILLLLSIYQRWKNLFSLLLGFISSFVIAIGLLVQLGWVRSLTHDVIGFGSTYVLGDRATFPKPVWTTLLTLIFVFSFIGLQLFPVLCTRNFKFFSVVAAMFFLVLGGYVVFTERQLNPIQTLTVLFRRIWISGLLSATVLGLLLLMYTFFRARKVPDFKMSTLVAMTSVAQLQVWPLFDQMHAWWAATPCVILAAVLLKSLNPLASLSNRSKSIYEHVLLGVVSLIAFATFVSTMSHTRVPLQINGFSGILISEDEGAELSAVNGFLQSQVSENDVVLNLCTNANIFFDPEFLPDSAARSFVFWTPMFDLAQLREDILYSNPTKIVSCSFVTNPIFYPEYQEKQNVVLDNFGLLTDEPDSFISPNGVTWEVYSRNTQA